MALTWYEQGVEEGYRQVLIMLLEDRFGPLPQHARDGLAELPVERFREIVRRLDRASSLDDLGLGNGKTTT